MESNLFKGHSSSAFGACNFSSIKVTLQTLQTGAVHTGHKAGLFGKFPAERALENFPLSQAIQFHFNKVQTLKIFPLLITELMVSILSTTETKASSGQKQHTRKMQSGQRDVRKKLSQEQTTAPKTQSGNLCGKREIRISAKGWQLRSETLSSSETPTSSAFNLNY